MSTVRRLALLVVAVGLPLTACQAPGDGPDAADPPGPPRVTPTAGTAVAEEVGGELGAECVNEQPGYRISYPADWHTNEGDLVPACTLFDPEPIDLEPGTEIPLSIAVSVTVSEAPMERIAAEQGPVRAIAVSDRQQTTVDGRPALVITGEGTGQALYPQGMGVYRYLVDLEEATLVAATHGAGDVDFDEQRRVLDRMMDAIAFTS